MAITINRESITPASSSGRKKSGHTKPKLLQISLNEPGRLRVAHLLGLVGVSHSTLYSGLKSGRYPAPDGHDGRLPYWNTETVRQFLQA